MLLIFKTLSNEQNLKKNSEEKKPVLLDISSSEGKFINIKKLF